MPAQQRPEPPGGRGGVGGYAAFLVAMHDPDHVQHDDMLEWVGGRFEPDEYDAVKASKRMRRGLPNWRRM